MPHQTVVDLFRSQNVFTNPRRLLRGRCDELLECSDQPVEPADGFLFERQQVHDCSHCDARRDRLVNTRSSTSADRAGQSGLIWRRRLTTNVQLAALKKLMSGDLASFNELIRDENVPAVVVEPAEAASGTQ